VEAVKEKRNRGGGREEFEPNLFGVFLMRFLGLTRKDLILLSEAQRLLSGEKKSEPSLDDSDSLGTKGDG